ncbi:MAG: peptidoglycan bridge formation glycyltransferase FemA/FemB family protein [Anaerolineaceae bacterium]|nr:peptidoglycan bridge formation glycyltransferase FemA/FemB family protein [Anaerolineaceae bacterium]
MIRNGSMALKRPQDMDQWDESIKDLPGAHLLQTREWASIKAPIGWQPLPCIWIDDSGVCQAACMILKRRIRIIPKVMEASILYAPKGPLVDWHDQELTTRILSDLKQIAHEEKSIFIKVDPDVTVATGLPGSEDEVVFSNAKDIQNNLQQLGWRYSRDQVQFRNTIIIDLAQSDNQILERMKQKTRYNIHLSERKGVVVRQGDLKDAPMLSKMYAETALRNGFAVRERRYFEHVWKDLFEAGMLQFLIAEYEQEPIAGLVLFHFSRRAYYFYGMSSETHRETMPTYLLQWEAIKAARKLGCEIYDLWGAPDEFDQKDDLWGVYRFKNGLGGSVVRTIGAWDYPAKPGLYLFYTRVMPHILAIMRYRGRQQTYQELG